MDLNTNIQFFSQSIHSTKEWTERNTGLSGYVAVNVFVKASRPTLIHRLRLAQAASYCKHSVYKPYNVLFSYRTLFDVWNM